MRRLTTPAASGSSSVLTVRDPKARRCTIEHSTMRHLRHGLFTPVFTPLKAPDPPHFYDIVTAQWLVDCDAARAMIGASTGLPK